ncbi:hypothetical protein E8E14_008164 [Neopestalotiopsis sp. 37M]|nr:hypothetical protein E8E14_008164 [Neopestalotiopsis sp. 37M]
MGVYPFNVARYFYDPKGLRQFNGPSIAGYSSFWRIWHNINWRHYLVVEEAHQRFGSHVRISPNHISILDPRAAVEIYGHGANMQKEGWYDAGAGPHRNMSDTRDKAQHQSKRKLFAHAFAARAVTSLEPELQKTIASLKSRLDVHISTSPETPLDMRYLINLFTIDLIASLLFGHELGCLGRGDDILTAEAPGKQLYKSDFIESLLDATVLNTAIGMSPQLLPITRAKEDPKDDLFSKLLRDSKGQKISMSLEELVSEYSPMMNAGTETTTSALVSTIFLLYSTPRALEKLLSELDEAFPGDTMPTYEAASKLPYLRACIEESFRLRPASSMGLPRIVPDGGRVIAGRFIQGGVTLSVPTYSLLRDKEAFDQPEEYNPDRWMTTDVKKKERMNKSHLPFSNGPRACIGRNISYFEQVLVIAHIFKFYDAKLTSETFDLEIEERFNSTPGQLPLVLSHRRMDVS